MLNRHPIRSFRRSESGMAALEFAIITPFLLMLIWGVFDISKAVILWHQVCNTSHTIPLSASTMSVQSDKTTNLTPAQAQQAMSSIYAEIPWLRDGIETGITSVTLTSVTFKPKNGCVPSPIINCTYVPYVIWSVAYAGGQGGAQNFQNVKRACGTLTQIGPADPLPPKNTNLTVLRTLNVQQPSPILVADVHYRYTPELPNYLNFVGGAADFWETGYWPVRTLNTSFNTLDQYTTYDSANTGDAVNCPDTWDN
jgi:hypothetical protein